MSEDKQQTAAAKEQQAYRLGTPLGVTNVQMLASLQLQTLGQALERCVALWGDRELLVFPARRCRARDLREEADRLARGLLSLGIEPGENVALWIENSLEFVVAEFALAKIGAVFVPLNTSCRTAELEQFLRQSDSTTIVMDAHRGDRDCLESLREICPEWSRPSGGRTRRGALPRLERAIVVGGAAPGMLAYDEVLARGETEQLRGVLETRQAAVKSDDILVLQFTSGVTAFPKAVMLAHGQVLRNAWQMARRAGFGAADRVLSDLPLFHAGGGLSAVLGAVSMGHTLCLTRAFDPAETLRLIEEENITGYIGNESMFSALPQHPDFHRRSRESLLKGWVAGNTVLLRKVAEEVGIRKVCSLYGLTEASPNVTITDWRDSQGKRLHSMGRPQAGVEIKILDLANGETASHGQRGEICVRGWTVMKGYYKLPEETAKAIDSQGWLHTGDLGFLDGDGCLVYTGRVRDVLHVGGQTVSTLQIERVLGTHPAVEAVAVIGVPDERLGEAPVACVKLKPGSEVSAEALIEYCKGKIAEYKAPRVVRFVDELELAGSGKVRKHTLRDRLLSDLS